MKSEFRLSAFGRNALTVVFLFSTLAALPLNIGAIRKGMAPNIRDALSARLKDTYACNAAPRGPQKFALSFHEFERPFTVRTASDYVSLLAGETTVKRPLGVIEMPGNCSNGSADPSITAFLQDTAVQDVINHPLSGRGHVTATPVKTPKL